VPQVRAFLGFREATVQDGHELVAWLAVLALHLLQISLVYVNTLMIQRVLGEPSWQEGLGLEDLRALTPLVYGHVNPYGTFRLDLDDRLPIESEAA
jgi:hypothetical protein